MVKKTAQQASPENGFQNVKVNTLFEKYWETTNSYKGM